MTRKKQNTPRKARKLQAESYPIDNLSDTEEAHEGRCSSPLGVENAEVTRKSGSSHTRVEYVDIDSNHNPGDDSYFELAEVILCDVTYGEVPLSKHWQFDQYETMEFSLRLKLVVPKSDNARVGWSWPLISANDVSVEVLIPASLTDSCQNNEQEAIGSSKSVLFSGHFDGPDEGVTSLAHLISQGFMTLRLNEHNKVVDIRSSCRISIAITKKTFDVSNGLSCTVRQPWKKSMMNAISWLRPEVTTDEVTYGVSTLEKREADHAVLEDSDASNELDNHFDTATFYEAIRRSKEEPMLEVNFPELLPELRPYQRRASYWMVQREKRNNPATEIERRKISNPLCVAVDSTDINSKMYYNPFSGSISMHPEGFLTYVHGGILADEMGLGKTVELLACILAHPRRSDQSDFVHGKVNPAEKGHRSLKRRKLERVDCVCGAVTESKYSGLWVQCDVCDAWQHADCVRFEINGKSDAKGIDESASDFEIEIRSNKATRKKRRKSLVMEGSADVIKTEKNFVCQTCSELIQISDCELVSCATLIVCPAPILQQWQNEIARHTKRGSLKVRVYGGVKDISSESTLDTMGTSLNELADADIVLTTYDILKSDLSHDSDRYYGDRRSMRFRKRYPVVPTPLTRIHWWRLCLDEAQMVESNAAAATEMAMRLSAKNLWCVTGTPIQRSLEDMYGLLRFLRAEPFDDRRWWNEVIKNPYERGNIGAIQFTHDIFRHLMWRSTKIQVSDELNLPPQEERLTLLTFSPIEAQFYRRQHESCAVNAREFIAKCKDDICKKSKQCNKKSHLIGYESSYDSRLSHGEAAKLLTSLLKLRQACCHPQVGSSGLRSLQQTPMTMEEILQVLIGKAKTEGEEALRKCVVALNGLAALAIIESDLSRAVSLYREASTLSEENLEYFRLDPLLNLHILHNLAEINDAVLSSSTNGNSKGEKTVNGSKKVDGKLFEGLMKKQRMLESGDSSSTRTLKKSIAIPDSCSREDPMAMDSCSNSDLQQQCECIKEKYMLQFITKLAAARDEFRSSYSQVIEARNDCQLVGGENWWFDALELVQQKKDLEKDLLDKIRDSLSGNDGRLNSSWPVSRFQDISGLKYIVQSGLDALENLRKALVDRLLDVDKMMDNPSDADIERVRSCSNCQTTDGGLLCLHCEMDELFQVYENKLFLLRVGDDGGAVISAEEALNLRKQRAALNKFFGGLSLEKDRKNKDVSETSTTTKSGRQRQNKGHVQVSRSPSELEVILNIIKSFVKTRVSKDQIRTAKRQLQILEAMRKEFTQARLLSVVQAQVLRAHDELKMAISRLRLRLPGEDPSSVGTLCTEELIPTSVQLTGEKFAALTELSRIKGQLRYLKGLSLAKQRQSDKYTMHSGEIEKLKTNRPREVTDDRVEQVVGKGGHETCPVCHEKLDTKLMVFPCGHLLCCNCMVSLVEMPSPLSAISQRKRIMCPTCRHCTDFGNIAYVDDGHGEKSYGETINKFQDGDRSELSISVRGSFGTKMEAVTRRILWIKSVDPKAKILVFSSWKDVLDVLEHSLHANEIKFVTMKGGSNSDITIRQFKGTVEEGKQSIRQRKEQWVEPNVLLLLFRHGANGLNLLEAHHVILIEPLLNPAAEAQAINRVHRIGQQNATFVHRFIVKETVEESIYKLNRSKPVNPSGCFGNIHKNDHSTLTLKDIDLLFSSGEQEQSYEECREGFEEVQHMGELRNLPPAVAAVLAAENRQKQALKRGA